MTNEHTPTLPPGLPRPEAQRDGLDAPYWDGVRADELRVQRCRDCSGYQWLAEWICHRCHSFDLGFEAVAPRGRIYSWERVWHPTHPALVAACPYVIVLVELPHADGVRMIGNLVGDPRADVPIGAEVEAVFEHHPDATLVQWRVVGPPPDNGEELLA